jgi:hypothetical protein
MDTIKFERLETPEDTSPPSVEPLYKEKEQYVNLSDIRNEFKSIVNDIECPSEIAARIGVIIESLPIADVSSPKEGRWVGNLVVKKYKRFFFFEREKKVAKGYYCSECGIWKRLPANYCPQCGCKMAK